MMIIIGNMMLLQQLLLLIFPIQQISSFFIPPVKNVVIHSNSQFHNNRNDSTRIRRSSISSSSDEFFDALLSPPSDDPSFKCSHMIGIPLEQNHDLLLELESIQRAILYHCPLLINACVAPVVTRMPLLLVDTQKNNNKVTASNGGNIDVNEILFNRNNNDLFATSETSGGENALLTSRDPITRTLHQIVTDVVQEMINVENTSLSKNANKEDTIDNNDADDDNEYREGLNNDNVKPLFMKFQGLEIDGEMNEILHAIGTEDEGTILLRNVLNEISKRIEQKGWKVYIPEDNPQGKLGGLNEDGVTWRPRIPFMRLPFDYYETLPDPKGFDGQWQDYSDEQKSTYIRTPEEGGNGISPLFWFKWWDDRLCNGKGVRIRELAVYGRTGPMGMTEQAFYIPHLRTRLPDGNEKLQEDERKDREYDNERRLEQEVLIDDHKNNENSSPETKFEKEMASNKSNADRRILQTIFDTSPDEMDLSAFDFEDDQALEENVPIAMQNENKTSSSKETRVVDDIKREEIIKSIAKPIATGDWTSLRPKKDKPSPEDNPILRNWNKRVAESPTILQNDTGSSKSSLPPFPSDDHFVGIWHLDILPRGSSVEEDRLFGTDVNENIVLRIDGTTAGGPILDMKNQHRAAGGTWKFFEAQWVGPTDDETEVLVKTRLRIRLLIPPLKEKVLVMEGEVSNGVFVSPESISRENMKEFRKSVFDSFIGKEEDKDKDISKEEDSILQCNGEMWVENATRPGTSGTSTKRVKVGRFSLSKMKEQGNNYKYSIPAPQRYQD